jgi:hypothetical protein
MEADWEVEIGPGAPVIDGAWSGIVDLERKPGRIKEVIEARDFEPLAKALLSLNATLPLSPTSPNLLLPIRTTKCDLWPVTGLDPDEMEATPAACLCGMAVYIDLLPRESGTFPDLAAAESWARELVRRLRPIPSPASRVDLVIRQAVTARQDGLGITAYVTGCGENSWKARESLSRALRTLAEAVTDSSSELNFRDPAR